MVRKKNPSLLVEEAKQNLRSAAAVEPLLLKTVRAAVRSRPKTGLLVGFVAGVILGSSAEARQTAKFFLTSLMADGVFPDACGPSTGEETPSANIPS